MASSWPKPRCRPWSWSSKRMANQIHPSAVIEPGAKLGDGVIIGPFTYVGAGVTLGDGVELKNHVSVMGNTTIGEKTRVFPFASLGAEPQDLKYRGEASTLVIGARCAIREGVTMNPGTAGGRMTTEVGDDCTFLANSHVGHDCKVGNHVILSNNVMLAGHVTVGNYVIFGGGSAAIQFSRVGDHAFVGGLSGIENDLIPYGLAMGNRAHLAGLNLVGLKRRGFDREVIHDLRRAWRLLFAPEGTLKERMEDVALEFPSQPQVHEILDFIRDGGERSICTPSESA